MSTIELAFIRNELYKGKFNDEYRSSLIKIKNNSLKNKSCFSGIICYCIDSALKFIENDDFKNAACEINFIHNFPSGNAKSSWDEEHFYTIELYGYL